MESLAKTKKKQLGEYECLYWPERASSKDLATGWLPKNTAHLPDEIFKQILDFIFFGANNKLWNHVLDNIATLV